ncbi:MAG TPA: DUF4215 domain-containing protein [Candidatus Binatia bacterium]|jgi:cysteine-rich repeat protein|nr:DUF4215 domain-containing protein [Candidatus Binatia bacterium]
MDVRNARWIGAIALGVMTIAASPAHAAQSKCLAGKTKCVAGRVAGLLKCHGTAEMPGKPANPNDKGCIDKVDAKFDGGPDPTKGCFEKLESKSGNDCLTFDDTTSTAILVDACVAQLVATIDPPPITQAKCGTGKKKCIATKMAGLLKCQGTAQTPGKPADPNTKGCVDKAKAKFDGGADPAKGCFEKLESKTPNDCETLDDTAAVEALVDACIEQVVASLSVPGTTTTTIATTTTTSPTTTTSSTSTTIGTTTTSSTSTTAPTTTTSSTSTTTSSTTSTTMGGPGVCGNGIPEGTEQCDDGNDDNNDDCVAGCKDAVCGDGFFYSGVEGCDDHNITNGDGCSSTCVVEPPVCGNNRIEAGETCDDGNTINGDACPSNCRIEFCSPTATRQDTTVTFTKPAGASVGSMVVFVNYPDAKVSLPGTGNGATVRARITTLPTGFVHTANDLDYAIREVLSPSLPGNILNGTTLFKASYDLCSGAAAPAAGEYTCTVEQVGAPNGTSISPAGFTCSVTLP